MPAFRENFHTINGTEIQLSIVESDFNIDIQCNPITYKIERKRRSKRILLAIFGGALVNYVIFNTSVMLPFNILFISWLFFNIYGLADLIEFGTNIILFIFLVNFVSSQLSHLCALFSVLFTCLKCRKCFFARLALSSIHH